MRNVERIDAVVEELARIWKLHPDLRLGQLILNLDTENRVYMMEDKVILEKMRWLYER